MKETLKKHWGIVLAIALPLLLIIIVALWVYIPSWTLSTKYNFIYQSCGVVQYPDRCGNRFLVSDGKLIMATPDEAGNTNVLPRIFLHDTLKNESREIGPAEAQSLMLSELLTSPDGVTVSYKDKYNNDFLFFGGGSTHGYYLTKGKSEKKLNLINENNYYYYDRNNAMFLGWVLPGRN